MKWNILTVYKDISVIPWDICNVLLTERIAESYELESEKIVCPHCGKEFKMPKTI